MTITLRYNMISLDWQIFDGPDRVVLHNRTVGLKDDTEDQRGKDATEGTRGDDNRLRAFWVKWRERADRRPYLRLARPDRVPS